MHSTLKKFGYPASVLLETQHWAVLLRPQQVTLGSMVLVLKAEGVTSLGGVGRAASREMPEICATIEAVLRDRLGAEKFNYLCLMMVDPHVHFHVLPRYGATVEMAGRRFEDRFWPGAPDIAGKLDLGSDEQATLQAMLGEAFAISGAVARSN